MIFKKFIIVILFSISIQSGQDYIDYPHPFHPTSSLGGMVVSQSALSSDIGVKFLIWEVMQLMLLLR